MRQPDDSVTDTWKDWLKKATNDLSQQTSRTLIKKKAQPLSFNAVRVKTKNLKFSREAANER